MLNSPSCEWLVCCTFTFIYLNLYKYMVFRGIWLLGSLLTINCKCFVLILQLHIQSLRLIIRTEGEAESVI